MTWTFPLTCHSYRQTHSASSRCSAISFQCSQVFPVIFRDHYHSATGGCPCVVSVVDEGMGISSDELPNLFSRAPGIGGSGSAIQRGGYGMGLAICRGIVEAHGGRIWAESDGPQLGARVNFTIPVAESVGTTAAESTPSAYQETNSSAY